MPGKVSVNSHARPGQLFAEYIRFFEADQDRFIARTIHAIDDLNQQPLGAAHPHRSRYERNPWRPCSPIPSGPSALNPDSTWLLFSAETNLSMCVQHLKSAGFRFKSTRVTGLPRLRVGLVLSAWVADKRASTLTRRASEGDRSHPNQTTFSHAMATSDCCS